MIEDNERSEEETLTDIGAEETAEAAPSAAPDDDYDIPEKYKGKSAKELVQILQEKEKFQGKQSQEVGELRGIVDSYIAQQSAQLANAPQEEEFDDGDFFANPKEAISKAVKNHPSVRQAEQVTQEYTRERSVQALRQAHPDMNQIIADPKFAQWIKGSKVRTELFVKADQQFDAEAANELFTLWKERAGYVSQATQVETQARQQEAAKASVGGGRGSNETPGKPIYRRSDIVNMMVERPDEYKRKLPEIRQAYQEKRVR